jgi:hypothetical protein
MSLAYKENKISENTFIREFTQEILKQNLL